MSGAALAGVLALPKVYNDDTVSPGWLGLVVFLAMALATVLLLRSFRHQLRKVPPTFDPPPDAPTGPPEPPVPPKVSA